MTKQGQGRLVTGFAIAGGGILKLCGLVYPNSGIGGGVGTAVLGIIGGAVIGGQSKSVSVTVA